MTLTDEIKKSYDPMKQAFEDFDKWDNAIAAELFTCDNDEWHYLSTVIKAFLYGRESGLKSDFEKEIKALKKENQSLYKAIARLKTWCEAYPKDVFPEPDLEKAANVLKENGLTLDSISASNFLHVLKGVKTILDELDNSLFGDMTNEEKYKDASIRG